MSLASRFGFGRRARETGLAGDPADQVATEPKGPTVRNALPHAGQRAQQATVHTPYASRYDDNADQPKALDRLGLSQTERELAARLFGDDVEEKAPEVRVRPPLPVKPTRKKLDRADLTLGALGVTLGFGRALGLDEKWLYTAIKAVGNYGESFERHLGSGSPIGLPRGLNDLWTRGGLMYALPLR